MAFYAILEEDSDADPVITLYCDNGTVPTNAVEKDILEENGDENDYLDLENDQEVSEQKKGGKKKKKKHGGDYDSDYSKCDSCEWFGQKSTTCKCDGNYCNAAKSSTSVQISFLCLTATVVAVQLLLWKLSEI